MFYNDVNQLVLYPVEQMIQRVREIRDDPLKAVNMSEQMYAREVKKGALSRPSTKSGQADKNTKNGFGGGSGETAAPSRSTSDMFRGYSEKIEWAKRVIACASSSASEPMETVILEKTIIKLGSLLALGFGEAGAHIIAANMGGTSYGVNVMVPGERVDCVIGHARIQNFSA